MLKNWSIRQLFLLVVVVLLVPPSLLLGYSIYRTHEDQIRHTHVRAMSLARTSAEDAAALIDDTRQVLERLASRPLVRALDPDRCDDILRDLGQLSWEYANLLALDASGQSICPVQRGQPIPISVPANGSGTRWPIGLS